MSVKVKYHLFEQNQHPIKSIALQKQYLAISSGIDEEWLSLQKVKIDSTATEPIIFEKAEIPTLSRRAINFLSWSPDGRLLASAFDKLTLWELHNDSLKKIQEYQDHNLEITAIAWSPDSTKIATCSLDAKVVITDIKTKQKIKEIDSGNKAVGIVWDPFDKYVACLRFDNKVVVWKVSNWDQFTEINLNFPNSQTEKYTSKREDRKIDWSPDCRFILVPSMDDRIVPIVCALDRHQEFKVSKTFIGPFSSVNTVKFSPILVNQSGQIQSVFAMGDNDGNISVWHLSQKGPEKPIFLLKNTSGELIEDIAWSRDGSVMMATTMKRYLIIVVFDVESTLGKPVNEEDSRKYLEDVYGGTRQQATSVIGQPQIQIRTFNNSKVDSIELPKPSMQVQIQPTSEQITYTSQSIVIQNGKKRIIPKMQVTKNIEHQQPVEIQQKTFSSLVPQSVLIMIKQPPVLPAQFVHYLATKEPSCLLFEVIRSPSTSTLLKCVRVKDKQDVKWADQVEGQIIHIQSNQDLICVYTDKNFLYVNNKIGKRQYPPVVLPGVCRMHLSSESDLLIIQELGDFKVLSLQEQRVILEGDIKNLINHAYEQMKQRGQLSEEELIGNQFFDPLIQAYLINDLDGGCVPHLLLKTQAIYSYQRNLNEWVRSKQLEINNSEVQKLQIIDVLQFNAKAKKNQNDSFFSKLVMDNNTPLQRIEAMSDIQQVAVFEEQLTQLSRFKDGNAFCNVVYSYIKKICDTLPLNGEKLHDIIMRLIVQENSEEAQYIEKAKVSKEDMKKNVVYILSQYPRAKEYRYLIQ